MVFLWGEEAGIGNMSKPFCATFSITKHMPCCGVSHPILAEARLCGYMKNSPSISFCVYALRSADKYSAVEMTLSFHLGV